MDNGTIKKVGAPRKRKIFWEKIQLCLGVSRRDLWALGGQAPLGSPGYLEVETRYVIVWGDGGAFTRSEEADGRLRTLFSDIGNALWT